MLVHGLDPVYAGEMQREDGCVAGRQFIEFGARGFHVLDDFPKDLRSGGTKSGMQYRACEPAQNCSR